MDTQGPQHPQCPSALACLGVEEQPLPLPAQLWRHQHTYTCLLQGAAFPPSKQMLRNDESDGWKVGFSSEMGYVHYYLCLFRTLFSANCGLIRTQQASNFQWQLSAWQSIKPLPC